MPLLKRYLVRWGSIIGVLVVVFALCGCSAVRLGYSNAPNLAYWWLDDYFDFDSPQGEHMRADLQTLHAWHRKEELPLLKDLLKNLQAAAALPVTPEQVCSLYAYLQTRAQVTGEHLAPALAAIAPTLQTAQMEHMAQRLDKRSRQWREEWMDGTPADIAERRVKQLVERAEWFYGRLDAPQMALVRAQMAAVEFDSAVELRESLRRHQDTVSTFRQLHTRSTPDLQAQNEIRALVARSVHSPEPSYRQYFSKISAQSCAVVAALHNSASPNQRQKLMQTLQAYENDARALSTP